MSLIKNTYENVVKDNLKKIVEQREEILSAFIAKYCIEPEEIVQMIQEGCDFIHENGKHILVTNWWIRKKTEKEKYVELIGFIKKLQDECEEQINKKPNTTKIIYFAKGGFQFGKEILEYIEGN